MTDTGCLRKRRVAVIEDESLIAMLIEDALVDAGADVVGHAGSVEKAIDLLRRERPDAVTLDGNLAGQLSGPVAACLREMQIPFLVVTGYGDLVVNDPHLSGAPRVSKPFTTATLIRAAVQHLC